MTTPSRPSPSPARPWELATDDSHPINLEVRYRTGDGCFFPYAYLVYCRYDRGGTIEMHFSSWVLRIDGRNLGELYTALNKHAILFVQEGSHDEQAREAEPHISALQVTESEA